MIASVGLFLLGGARSLFKWLLSLPWYEIVILALSLVCVVEYGLLHGERSHARKLDARLHTCLIVQQNLIDQSKQKQKIITQDVNHYIKVEKPIIQKEVQRIETAPIVVPGKTPKEVLDADI